jgi:acetamidase/formamidase
MAKTHHLNPSPSTVHWGFFDSRLPPISTIESGDTVVVETVSGGLEEVGDAALLSPIHLEIVSKVPRVLGPHILTGPVAVQGSQPGDTLEFRILEIELTVDWGWNVIRPLRGTLPEDFPYFSRRIIPIDRERQIARLPWGVDIPVNPFFGIIGVAPPPAYGVVSSVEPREYGGNIDNKEFTAGTSLFLPVFVPGANFSIGDGHAVQGDGEVCLTALETCLKGRF